ncbi:MAG: kelch repeat-containing protein [Bacteroidota bacterium]
MKKALIILLIGFILGSCSTPKNVIPIKVTGTWEKVTATKGEPVARHEAAFVGIGDKFYLIGGRRINPTSIYDTKSKKWTQGAKPPIEMHHFQPLVYQNKIYILGAMTGGYPGETPVPNIYIYDPVSDSWEKGAAIPEDRQRGGAGVSLYKGKFYLSCGIKDGHRGDHKKWLDVYDPKTEKWEQLPDAPRERDHFQSVVANDKLYLLGGRTTVAADNPFKNTITEVDVYDFKKGTWSTLENGLPTERAGNFTALYGKDILVFGGESFNQKLAHSEVEALNVKTHTWRSLSPMQEGRHGTGAVIHNGKICVASGCGNRGGSPELKSMECLSF